MRFFAAALTLLLMQGGCTETLARFATDASDLHQATSAYMRENVEQRRFVRAECRASLVRQIETLRGENKEVEIQRLLRENYPSLVTLEILNAIDDHVTSILSEPPSCGIDLGVFRQ